MDLFYKSMHSEVLNVISILRWLINVVERNSFTIWFSRVTPVNSHKMSVIT